MNKLKINVDRPIMSSKDISNQMNFEDILTNHKIMAKPFYKSTWFFGVTGLATISLIAGSVYSLNKEGDELYHQAQFTESVPFEVEKVNPKIIALYTDSDKEIQKPIDKKSTLITKKKTKLENEPEIITPNSVNDDLIEEEVSKVKNESLNEIPKTFSFIDLHPRISGKLDGKITKEELIDEKGLVTASDVEIISFQLHVVNGMGSNVFDSNDNMLSSEMKSALKNVNVGEEIYFEKIQGKATTGEILHLLPIRYVLLN